MIQPTPGCKWAVPKRAPETRAHCRDRLSGPHNKAPWLQELSLPSRSSGPAPSRQDAGAPSVPGFPGLGPRASRPHRVCTTKRRGSRNSPCLLDPPWPAPSWQDAGVPSVPGFPGTAGVSPASGLHNKAPWLQPKSSAMKWLSDFRLCVPVPNFRTFCLSENHEGRHQFRIRTCLRGSNREGCGGLRFAIVIETRCRPVGRPQGAPRRFFVEKESMQAPPASCW